MSFFWGISPIVSLPFFSGISLVSRSFFWGISPIVSLPFFSGISLVSRSFFWGHPANPVIASIYTTKHLEHRFWKNSAQRKLINWFVFSATVYM
jgi:hypothetical protein